MSQSSISVLLSARAGVTGYLGFSPDWFPEKRGEMAYVDCGYHALVRGGEVGGDFGLFGPSSVTWHLHADPAMWPGGVRALFLQALHPLAVTGLAQNSAFTQDPVARLLRTGEFIVATTWGTRAQAERARAMVRSVHSRMRITDPDTGFPEGRGAASRARMACGDRSALR
jgi:hypothetical protein